MKKIKKLALRGLKVQIKSYVIVLRIPRLSLLSVTGMGYTQNGLQKNCILSKVLHTLSRGKEHSYILVILQNWTMMRGQSQLLKTNYTMQCLPSVIFLNQGIIKYKYNKSTFYFDHNHQHNM